MFKMKTDFLRGPILKSLLIFAAPMLLSNVFQQLYSTADMMIVGHVLGEASLAAIGASGVIFELLVGFALGVGGGFGIVVARSAGAGDGDLLRRAVAGALIQGFTLVTVISVAAGIFMRPLLRLLDTPAAIIDEAYSYISVLIAFAAVLFLYNLCAGLLRAVGNSTAPLLFLILSSILNIGLDFLFITVWHMGVRGAALGTVTAQGVSAALCLIYIARKCPELVPRREHFRIDWKLYKELAAQGFSMGFMMSIVTVGSVILQRSINGLGALVIAGHVAARRFNSFCLLPIVAMAFALSTFVSQNKGADRPDRIRKAVRYGNLIALGWGLSVSVLLLFSSAFLIRLLSGSDESVIIENGSRYLTVNAPFYVVLGVLLNLRFALQGIGTKITPVVSSVIELIGKTVFAFLLVPALGYFGVIICEPAIWICICIQLLYAFHKNPYIRGQVE